MFTYIIPCKNNVALLQQALNSIDFDHPLIEEVFVIDDNSDNPLSSELSFYHDKLRVKLNALDPGIVGALNYGITLTTTDYIIRLDSDDLDLPERIEITAKAISDFPYADIISFSKIDIPENYLTNLHWKNKQELETLLCFGNPLYHPTVCLKTSAIKKIKYEDFCLPNGVILKGVEDYLLWCRCYLLNLNIHNFPEPAIKYRKWDGQISNTKKNIDPAAYVSKWFQLSLKRNTLEASYSLFQLTLNNKNSKFYLFYIEFLISAIKRRYNSAKVTYKFFWAALYFYIRIVYRWK